MRGTVVATLIVCALGCKRTEPQEIEPPQKPAPASASASSSSPAPIASAVSEMEKSLPADCKSVQRIALPGGDAAMIYYACATSGDRVELVAPGGSKTLTGPLSLEPSVHGFWTPFGPDRTFVAVRRGAQSELYRYADHRFVDEPPIVLPWRLLPAAQIDIDKNGTPELAVPLWILPLGGPLERCSPAETAALEDAATAPKLNVDGLAAWSPTKNAFSTTLSSFKPWYAMRLSGARSLAKHLAATPDAGPCKVDEVRTAIEIAIYGRVLGEDGKKLDDEATTIAGSVDGWSKILAAIDAAQTPSLVDSP